MLLCSGADIGLRRRLVTTSADGAMAPTELAAKAWALFRELLRYLDARTCRHDFILRYFGDEQELLGGCGHCDVCAAVESSGGRRGHEAGALELQATATVVRMALSAVARARQRAGLGAIAEMLRGVDGERTRRFGFTELSTFGLLRERSPAWVADLLRGLLAAGWIESDADRPSGAAAHASRRPRDARDRAAALRPSRRANAQADRARRPGSTG